MSVREKIIAGADLDEAEFNSQPDAVRKKLIDNADLTEDEFNSIVEPTKEKTGALESIGRGLEQGLSLGSSDEIRAGLAGAPMEARGLPAGIGITFGDVAPDFTPEQSARQAEEKLKSEHEALLSAKASHPYLYGAGELAGGIATLPAAGIRGAAGLGAVAGAMTGDTIKERIGGAAVGGLTGAGLAAAAPYVAGAAKSISGKVSDYLSDKFRGVANKQVIKSLNVTPTMEKNMKKYGLTEEEIANWLFENKIVSGLSTAAEREAAVAALEHKAGKEIGEIIKQTTSLGPSSEYAVEMVEEPFTKTVTKNIEAAPGPESFISESYVPPVVSQQVEEVGTRQVPKVIKKEVPGIGITTDQIEKDVTGILSDLLDEGAVNSIQNNIAGAFRRLGKKPGDPLNAQELMKLKDIVSDWARFESRSQSTSAKYYGKIYGDIADRIDELVDSASGQLGKEMLPGFTKAKRDYQISKTLEKPLDYAAGKEAMAPNLGLKDIVFGNLGTTPVTKIAGMAASHIAGKYGRTMAASTADKIARSLPNAPPKIQSAFQSSMSRGPQSIAVTDYILSQSDPEYQAWRKQVEESEQ